MNRVELEALVKRVLAKCGEGGGDPDKIEIRNLPEAIKCAASLVFLKRLSETPDTANLRDQYGSLHHRGVLMLEEVQVTAPKPWKGKP